MPAIRTPGRRITAAHRVKRAMDVAVSAAALMAMSPIIAIVAAAIRLRMGRPVLFRQLRPGYMERPFTVLKFRTMKDVPEEERDSLDEAELVTDLGRFLRRTSLDELPQLWNVLTGDMSLVGPRPLAMQYLPHYTDEQRRRHHVKPGITGWAQVTGRHLVTWEERFARDVWYVDHWSLGLDLKIIAMTARVLLSGSPSVPPPTANFGEASRQQGS